jgi:WD40 repeat protein
VFPYVDALVTGSWDQTLRLWDARSATPLQHTSTLPERIYHASAVGSTLAVALASRLFHIYDLRNLSAGPRQERESSLKFMTRSLACMPNGEGYATGSVEGRIAVEYFDEKAQDRKYAFKCHRSTVGEVDHVWPVTALAFHPVYVFPEYHPHFTFPLSVSCFLYTIVSAVWTKALVCSVSYSFIPLLPPSAHHFLQLQHICLRRL